MTSGPDIASPQHSSLSSEVEYETAIDKVISYATQTLHIFDIDLAKGGFSSVARCDALRGMLAAHRGLKVIIVLHEIEFLTRHCPRLMQLLKTYSHAITIRQTQEHGRIASDPVVIADETHYIHRFHADNPRALLALHDPGGAKPLEERFVQLVDDSIPAVFADTLGL